MQKQFIVGKIAFSTNGAGATGHLDFCREKKKELWCNLIPSIKINSKIECTLKCKTIKRLEKIENIWALGLGKKFLDLTPNSWSIKRKICKLDIIKI